MPWNPSPEVAVARDAAKKLDADIGAVIIYLKSDRALGIASYGANKALCAEMGKLGDRLYDATMEYFANAD